MTKFHKAHHHFTFHSVKCCTIVFRATILSCVIYTVKSANVQTHCLKKMSKLETNSDLFIVSVQNLIST